MYISKETYELFKFALEEHHKNPFLDEAGVFYMEKMIALFEAYALLEGLELWTKNY